MRLLLLAFVILLSSAAAAWAAPTCNDMEGRTVRCGTPGAMPVGWIPPPEVLEIRRAAAPPGPNPTEIFGIACFIGGLLALFALLPDFEDGKGGGWDREDDDET
ncbi:hypothetical protein [Phenylobacterium sp.]|uniref:hypothetical protein n=1 Tax=Phenylobacterium sp. TaxID=1871053 RepID=UPI0025CF4578|nr:hypothetical protein [Phenylobacterium sp.]